MKVLVVGGSGHIGSYLVPRLVAKGFEVSVVARNPLPKYANPVLFWNQVNWIIADRLTALTFMQYILPVAVFPKRSDCWGINRGIRLNRFFRNASNIY